MCRAVLQEGVALGLWERIYQTPPVRYVRDVKNPAWPDVSRYP